MKIESSIKPLEKFEIKNISKDQCMVFFYQNVNEKEALDKEEKQKTYLYDMYKMIVRSRRNLWSDIEKNYEIWVQFAKNSEYENLAKEIREKRDKLLNETDWTQVTDSVLSTEKQEEYKIYRQTLRDITKQQEFPYKVTFPYKPKE